jgi:hypothetical protein
MAESMTGKTCALTTFAPTKIKNEKEYYHLRAYCRHCGFYFNAVYYQLHKPL